jgi:hypothetical protein
MFPLFIELPCPTLFSTLHWIRDAADTLVFYEGRGSLNPTMQSTVMANEDAAMAVPAIWDPPWPA